MTVTEDRTVRAQIPEGNDVFEEIVLDSASKTIALRLVTTPEEGSGSSSSLLSESESESDLSSPEPECYLGFSTDNGRAQCYEDSNNINVRLYIELPL